MRIPEPLKPEFEKRIEEYRLRVLKGVDSEVQFDRLQQIADSIKTDLTITRNGKDSGAVKRAVDAFLSRLREANT